MVVPAFQILPPAPRILIFRGGALGDFLLTLPLFRALRRAWPKADITVVGIPRIAELARISGLVDRVLDIDSARFAAYFVADRPLPPEESGFLGSFDLVVSFLHDPAGALRSSWERAGARRVIGAAPQVTAGHAADHYLGALKPLGLTVRVSHGAGDFTPGEECRTTRRGLAQPNGHAPSCETAAGMSRRVRQALRLPARVIALQLDLPADLQERGQAKLESVGLTAPVIAIHPGSGSRAKNWPLTSFLALAGKIRNAGLGNVLWIAGEADAAIARSLKATLLPGAGVKGRAPILEGCRLTEVAAVLSRCQAYVGNDSGITHLAAAVGVPAVAVFGPTDPAIWGPRGRQVVILRARPPTTAGLKELPMGDVFQALRKLDLTPATAVRSNSSRTDVFVIPPIGCRPAGQGTGMESQHEGRHDPRLPGIQHAERPRAFGWQPVGLPAIKAGLPYGTIALQSAIQEDGGLRRSQSPTAS